MTLGTARGFSVVSCVVMAIDPVYLLLLFRRLDAAPADSLGHPSGVDYVVLTMPFAAGSLALVAAWGMRRIHPGAWLLGVGAVLLMGGVGSFLVLNEPTTINVFGFLVVQLGAVLILVGCIVGLVRRTPEVGRSPR